MTEELEERQDERYDDWYGDNWDDLMNEFISDNKKAFVDFCLEDDNIKKDFCDKDEYWKFIKEKYADSFEG